jgi:hypothetical protein
MQDPLGTRKRAQTLVEDGFIFSPIKTSMEGIVSVKSGKTSVNIRDPDIWTGKSRDRYLHHIAASDKGHAEGGYNWRFFRSPINQRDYPKIQRCIIVTFKRQKPDIPPGVFFYKAETPGEKNSGCLKGNRNGLS